MISSRLEYWRGRTRWEAMAHHPPSPGFITPALRTLVEVPPIGGGWIHEIKHDGYRTQLVMEDGRCRAFTRNGHD